jgi:hypothetical protein
MKRHFVLDENIIVFAQKGENEHGEPDTVCLQLILDIERNCHALVLGESFWGKYSGQVRALERQRVPLVPRVMAIVRSLLANLDKDTQFVANERLVAIAGLDRLPGIDEGDRDFVRVAASVPGAILVTRDGPLATAVAEQGIAQEHGFAVLVPEGALVLAGPAID